jgi:ABC-2 type transport system permease protein
VTRALKLFLLYIRVSIQNLAAYRFDLTVRLAVSIMHLVGELLGVWTIFSNTTNLKGWHWQHMLVLVGVYRIVAGGIRMSIVPNMRRVLEEIRDGTLDFVLLRPVNAQFLVSIREFVVWRIADVAIGFAVALYGCVKLLGHVPPTTLVLFVLMLAAGYVIVYSIWLMLATIGFWLVRVQNIEMIFWNVFEAGHFPINIYRPEVQWVLTFLIPLAFITTFPAGTLVGDPATKVPLAAPLYASIFAVLMLLVSGWFWRFGLRRYSGASA